MTAPRIIALTGGVALILLALGALVLAALWAPQLAYPVVHCPDGSRPYADYPVSMSGPPAVKCFDPNDEKQWPIP